MSGRDPHEHGRTATSLELLFDLVFVVAVGQAASQFAHLLAAGHVVAGIGAFAFAMYAIVWGWINFSWFASAFDTDDWPQRLATMVQMVGVTILGLGLAPVFHSLDAGHAPDNHLIVAGYVVMRVAMVFQWLRAAKQSPRYRPACLAYATAIIIAQIGWVFTLVMHLDLTQSILAYAVLMLVELGGPYVAETFFHGTPWHAHHIAERYSGFAIIALGEGVVGTVASLSAIVEESGWTLDAALVAIAGMGLTFGMWWAYFLTTPGEILHVHRRRAFKWGYGSIVVFAAIAATGAGLDVAALFIEHKASIGAVGAVLAVSIPVALYLLSVYWLYSALYAEVHWFHLVLLAITAAVIVAAPLLAAAGVSMTLCLLVVMLAPAVSVIGYELHGYRHVSQALQRTLDTAP